jgi:hypothetical protein
MPIFQHGKNAFLALGFENSTGTANVFSSMSSTSVSGTAGTLIQSGSLAASDNVLATVNATSYYGYFVNPTTSQTFSPLPSLTTPVIATTLASTSSTSISFSNTIVTGATSGTGYLLPMWNISPYINDISFPQAVEAAETTSFNAAGVKSYIVGLRDYTVTFSGHYDGSSTIMGQAGGLDAIFQTALAFQNTAGQFISFVYGPSDPGAFVGGTASPKYFGQGILTKYDLKSSVNGVVTFDAEMQVTGSVSRTTI